LEDPDKTSWVDFHAISAVLPHEQEGYVHLLLTGGQEIVVRGEDPDKFFGELHYCFADNKET
jgi:hypothetical protein